jgi:hypothetical protein
MGAVAAAILVIVGFLRAFQSRFGAPGPEPTAVTARLLGTPTPLPTLGPAAPPVPRTRPSWQAHTLSSQFVQPPLGSSFAVSASDGATAYICHAAPVSGGDGEQQAQIWVTHNLGTQWTHIGDLPQPGWGLLSCTLEVDSSDSQRLLAIVTGESTLTSDWFTSDDGGVSWTKILSDPNASTAASTSHPQIVIDHIATTQGKTYAIYTSLSAWLPNVPTSTSAPNQPGGYPGAVNIHLAVSGDGLRTWRPVDEPILALVGSSHYVTGFWSQVGAGGLVTLLAEVGGGPRPNPQTLWESVDGGTHWSELPAPQLNFFTAQTLSSSHSWYICGWSSGAGSQVRPDLVTACSMDGGETWSARPVIRTCESCPPQSLPGADDYITSDGSLLALFYYQNSSSSALYRLPANSSQWQYLGQMPDGDSGLVYVPAPPPASGGYLWSFYDVIDWDLSMVIEGAQIAATTFFTAAEPA